MWDWLREMYRMQYKRKLVRCRIIERTKRAEAIDVRKFFTFTPELTPIIVECNGDVTRLLQWVKNHIAYVPDAVDFWSYPAETLARLNGDCEDQAILLANLLVQTGIPYYKVLIAVYGSHVVVELDGVILDSTGAGVSADVPLWYCWNARNAYTCRECIK